MPMMSCACNCLRPAEKTPNKLNKTFKCLIDRSFQSLCNMTLSVAQNLLLATRSITLPVKLGFVNSYLTRQA